MEACKMSELKNKNNIKDDVLNQNQSKSTQKNKGIQSISKSEEVLTSDLKSEPKTKSKRNTKTDDVTADITHEKATKTVKKTKATQPSDQDLNLAPRASAKDLKSIKEAKISKVSKTTETDLKDATDDVNRTSKKTSTARSKKTVEAPSQNAAASNNSPSLNTSNPASTDPQELTEQKLLAMSNDDYMNALQLDFFKKRLQKIRHDILENADQTTENLRETVYVPDPVDRASIEEEHALELRTRDRERKLLAKIEQSLKKIEDGSYGWCDETGEPIGVPRLLARPTANLCLEAQERRELRQKMFGD
jgi:DnaK suppressor protein